MEYELGKANREFCEFLCPDTVCPGALKKFRVSIDPVNLQFSCRYHTYTERNRISLEELAQIIAKVDDEKLKTQLKRFAKQLN